ncbi:prolyl-tRNA synthetase associated domain-containing protein [Filimonas effusa]|uniref:Prolyl-tRNA synthetase associated domain-containing protein n=2 Tax=Filimonas effusa TaxID=2508721 RepID=A0A4Q1D695_9BACT|nr:prolyl-tRNA synthetase associated domain-containing protein [Filimonas effusa]
MFYISEVKSTAPAAFQTTLQEMVYHVLQQFNVCYERVDTDEAITMEDCLLIDEKLNMQTVKTLFLCNRQQTDFYLLITTAGKPFKTKDLSSLLGISRLSFAPADLLEQMLGTKVGGASIFSVMLDKDNKVQVVLDEDAISSEWYGCNDGTSTSYMKLKTEWVVNEFLAFAHHKPKIIKL